MSQTREQKQPALVERIVTSHKGYYTVDPENPRNRIRVPKGGRVRVTPLQAKTFKHVLTDPAVLKAQIEAAAAEVEAEEEEEEEEDAKPKGGTAAQPPKGPSK